MASIDELYIGIQANAVKANDSIDKLSQKIGNLSTSLMSLKTGNLTGLANGVNKLASSMQAMKNVGTADFTRLTKNLNNLGTVNTASLNRLASATTQIGKSFSGLNDGTTSGIKTMGELANGIKQLGYASSTKAINNIPQLANALREMMATLSTAPNVSNNLIQMTNALAKLARTGGAAGSAANSLTRSFNRVPSATSKAKRGFVSLASTIGKVYATYWLLFRAFEKISQAMGLASNLTEVENVINHTFGAMRTKLDDFTKDSVEKFGLAELSAKQYAGRFQAMGKAMGISNNAVAKSTEFLNGKLGENASIYGNLGNSMADMSINLTKLTSDYASFFDVAQSDVAEDFQSIFTGQTRPLRAYGLDLTNATLKEYALNNGLNANIKTMSQAEKTLLRYQYVMANSSHIMGDFARTSDTWHNTITRLKNNFQTLGITVGKAFINLLKPVAVFVNNAIVGLNKVAVAISNALGKLLGWKYEEGSGGMTTEYEDAADYADDMAGSTGDAVKAAKDLKKQLQGIDELNVLTTNKDNGGGGGAGGGSGASGGSGSTGEDGSWTKTEGMWKWDGETWRDLGRQIGDGLKTAMESIDWDKAYQGAANFGTGLAEFLNGLFEGEKGNTLFGEVGKTVAGALNTSLQFLYSYAKTFDWTQFGVNLADGINQFFRTFDFGLLADTLNKWVDGIKESIFTFLKEVKWVDVIKGALDFVNGLELDTLAVMIGAFTWHHGGKEIVAGSLGSLLSKQIKTGIGTSTISVSATIGITLAVATLGYKFGEWLYENTGVGNIADAIAEWITKDGEEIAIARTISVTLTGLTISLGTAGIVGAISKAITTAITTASAEASLSGTGVGAVILGKIGTAISGATGAISGLAESIKIALTTAISKIGTIALKLGTLALGIGVDAFAIKLTSDTEENLGTGMGKAIGAGILAWAGTSLTLKALGLSSLAITIGGASLPVAIPIAVGLGSFKLGKTFYETIPSVQEWADSLVELILGDYTWSEIGKAISDGAIVDAFITPVLKWGSGDDSITTQEVIDAGAQMIEDVVEGIKNLPEKALDVTINLGEKLTGLTLTDEQKEQIKKSFSKLPSVAVDMVANLTGWDKDKSFKENISGMIAKFGSWVLDTVFGKTIGGMIAEFFGWDKDENKGFSNKIGGLTALFSKSEKGEGFGSKIGGLIASFTGKEKGNGFDSTIGKMKASFSSKEKDNGFNSTIGDMVAKFSSWKKEGGKGGFSNTITNMVAKFSSWKKETGKSGFNNTIGGMIAKLTRYTDKIPKKKKELSFTAKITKVAGTAWNSLKKFITGKANGGVYKYGKWQDIPQYAEGGFPSHGSMFIAGEKGAEVVGHINGSTEVLNQSQMASTMYQAVVSANSEQNQLLRQQNQLLAGILEKETGISYKDVFKATQQGNKEYKSMHGGVSAFI